MPMFDRLGKYDLIVVDPPWPVKKVVRKVRPNQKQDIGYKTMSAEEIMGLPVAEHAMDNCTLLLWTTHAMLPLSIEVVRAWGFKYKRVLTWDKRNGMTLCGFHHRTELCIVATKGATSTFVHGKAIPTVFSARSTRHSAKPDEFYDMVKKLGSKRVDIFARKTRDGWDVYGDEINV